MARGPGRQERQIRDARDARFGTPGSVLRPSAVQFRDPGVVNSESVLGSVLGSFVFFSD